MIIENLTSHGLTQFERGCHGERQKIPIPIT